MIIRWSAYAMRRAAKTKHVHFSHIHGESKTQRTIFRNFSKRWSIDFQNTLAFCTMDRVT